MGFNSGFKVLILDEVNSFKITTKIRNNYFIAAVSKQLVGKKYY